MDQTEGGQAFEGVATALWCRNEDAYALQNERFVAGPDAIAIETSYSLVSRGTERLVLEGRVPPSEYERMQAPFQAGRFPFPVKYGYALSGRVIAGPPALIGKSVFALHPHQDRLALPQDNVIAVPDGVPLKRATLAANMETALNAVWDSGVSAGERVLVVGCGVVGLMIASLIARMPGTVVHCVDLMQERAAITEALGAQFGETDDVDVAFNATGRGAGLQTAIDAAGFEARIVEVSWLGDERTTLSLGGAFHSKRLTIQSSQVGHVATSRARRVSHRRRLTTAMGLLRDERLDALFTHTVPFADAPQRLPTLIKAASPLAIALNYGASKRP